MSFFVVNSPSTKLLKSEVLIKSLVVSAVVLFISLILAMSRAFNTGDMGGLHRLVLWVIVCGLIAGQVLGLSLFLRRYISRASSYAILLPGVVSIVLTIPLVALEMHGLKYTPILPKQVDPPLEFLLFVAPPVAVIGALFLLVQYLLQPSLGALNERLSSNSESDFDIEATSVPEWRKLKTLRIQVDDHYLRIVGEFQEFYVRGKLSDAVKLLGLEEGMQVHRSHWVSFDFVKGLVKEGRDYRLELVDGGFVPVGRGRLGEVRELLGRV